jgi:long-chain fatty acid transport protein
MLPTHISQASGRSSGSNKGDMVPLTAVPFGFCTNTLNEQWAVGLGVYAPFDLVADYENGVQGKAFGSNSGVKVITQQPTVSYAFNDKVSVGFGPPLNRMTGTRESDVNLPIAGTGANNIKMEGARIPLGGSTRRAHSGDRHHAPRPNLSFGSQIQTRGPHQSQLGRECSSLSPQQQSL